MLQKVSFNVVVTIIVTGVCFYLFHQSGIMEDAGMAALILNWLPIMIGLGTLVAYFIVRLITKKWGWIITLLGALFNIWLVISSFMQAGAEVV